MLETKNDFRIETFDPNKRPHPRAVLKNLPPEKQLEIIVHLDGPGGEDYMKTAAWLKNDGIPATPQMVSKFREWYLLREGLLDDEDFAMEVTAFCKAQGLIKTAKEERAAAQMFFNRRVLRREDPRMWSIVERVNLVKDKVGIEEEKLELQKKKFEDKRAKKRKKALPGKMTDEEKEAAIRQIYGMEPVRREIKN